MVLYYYVISAACTNVGRDSAELEFHTLSHG